MMLINLDNVYPSEATQYSGDEKCHFPEKSTIFRGTLNAGMELCIETCKVLRCIESFNNQNLCISSRFDIVPFPAP